MKKETLTNIRAALIRAQDGIDTAKLLLKQLEERRATAKELVKEHPVFEDVDREWIDRIVKDDTEWDRSNRDQTIVARVPPFQDTDTANEQPEPQFTCTANGPISYIPKQQDVADDIKAQISKAAHGLDRNNLDDA